MTARCGDTRQWPPPRRASAGSVFPVITAQLVHQRTLRGGDERHSRTTHRKTFKQVRQQWEWCRRRLRLAEGKPGESHSPTERSRMQFKNRPQETTFAKPLVAYSAPRSSQSCFSPVRPGAVAITSASGRTETRSIGGLPRPAVATIVRSSSFAPAGEANSSSTRLWRKNRPMKEISRKFSNPP